MKKTLLLLTTLFFMSACSTDDTPDPDPTGDGSNGNNSTSEGTNNGTDNENDEGQETDENEPTEITHDTEIELDYPVMPYEDMMNEADQFTDMELEVNGLAVQAIEEEDVYTIWISHQADPDQVFLGILPKDSQGSEEFAIGELSLLLSDFSMPAGITADATFVDIFSYENTEGDEISLPRLYIENVETIPFENHRFYGMTMLGDQLIEARMGDTLSFMNDSIVINIDDFRPITDVDGDYYYLVYTITNNSDETIQYPVLFAPAQNGQEKLESTAGMIASNELSDYAFQPEVEPGESIQTYELYSDLDPEASVDFTIAPITPSDDLEMIVENYILRVNIPTME